MNTFLSINLQFDVKNLIESGINSNLFIYVYLAEHHLDQVEEKSVLRDEKTSQSPLVHDLEARI